MAERYPDTQYKDLLKHIMAKGVRKETPQGVDCVAVCAPQLRYDLSNGFPLLTERSLKGSWKSAIGELLWILTGSTKVEDLHTFGVHFWDQWATPEFCAMNNLPPGEFGPIYGKQWRFFSGGGEKPVDQISRLIGRLKKAPDSRRHVVTSWNPEDVEDDQFKTKVCIAPCHGTFHVFHANGELTLVLNQRSGDVPIGIPFNTAEYALLLMMIAQVTGLQAKELVHNIMDAHIYQDQISYMEELITRESRLYPTVSLNPNVKDIFDFTQTDFTLEDYDPHPSMKDIPVAT